jgi:hypothetical protein
VRAFRAFDFVSRLPNRQSEGANRRKSPAKPANIPVLQRLSAKTKFDHDCPVRPAVKFAVISDPGWALGPRAPRLFKPLAFSSIFAQFVNALLFDGIDKFSAKFIERSDKTGVCADVQFVQ